MVTFAQHHLVNLCITYEIPVCSLTGSRLLLLLLLSALFLFSFSFLVQDHVKLAIELSEKMESSKPAYVAAFLMVRFYSKSSGLIH